jgi:hypothetical protein
MGDELSTKTDSRVIIQNSYCGVRKTPRSKGMVNFNSVLKYFNNTVTCITSC